jgi:hypothetical protein
MARTGDKKAFCVLEFAKSESIVTVQRSTTQSHLRTIYEWYKKLQQSGCAAYELRNEQADRGHRPGLSSVCEKLCQEPSEVITSREPGIVDASVKRLAHSAQTSSRKGYRLQMLQALNPQDHNFRFQFCVDFQQRLVEDGLLRSWFPVTRRRYMCVVR